MNPLRAFALATLLLAAPTTVTGLAQPANVPAITLAPDGWSPAPRLLERATHLATLAPDAARQYLAKLDAESPELAFETCRAGLRLRDDRAALACAVHLPWDVLDNWEHERVIALSLDHYARPGTIVDFEKLRSMIGSVDLDRVLDRFPPGPWESTPTDYLGNLHRQLRAAHIPALCRLAASTSDKDVRETTISNLNVILPRTNRHRALVAKTFLGDANAKSPSTTTADPERTGLHPLLVRLLRENWLADESTSQGWEIRWLHDSIPVAADAPLLAEIATSERWVGSDEQVAAVRAMRHLQDPASLAVLRAFAADEDSPGDLRFIAEAALIQCGATLKSWTKLAAAAAADDESALGLWFELQPKASVRTFADRILRGDASSAHAALDQYERASGEVRSMMHLRWSPTLFDGFAEAALNSNADGFVLGRIGAIIPGCNTTALAGAACARLTKDPDPLRRILASKVHRGSLETVFPFLEVAAPDGFRRMLRALADAGEPLRTIALTTLLTIGDRASDERLLAWVTSGRAEKDIPSAPTGYSDVDVHGFAVLLARSGGPAIRAYLEKLARTARSSDATQALAVIHGIPNTIAQGMATIDGLELPPAEARSLSEAIVSHLLGGRAKEALAVYLAEDPVTYIGEIWRFDTPAVRAYLGRLRQARARRLYAFATAGLAAMGDTAARNESLAVMRAGRYRWVDEVFEDADLATLGFDFKRTIPFWIDELESNCCRRVIASNVFEDTFGLTPEVSDGVAEIPADRMRRWWRRHEQDKFGRSRISGRFVPYR